MTSSESIFIFNLKFSIMNQPQSIEMEEAVLSACLIETTAMSMVSNKLRAEMFYDPKHQKVFEALQHMYAAGTAIDILTVTEELRKRGQIDEIGGAYFVVQLSSHVASSAHLAYHVNVVHEKFVRRQMILGFNKLFALAADDTMDLDETMREAHELLDSIESEFGCKSHLREIDVLMSDTMREAQGRISNNRNGITGIPTGLSELDKITAGWQKGDLNIIAARPSVGKTAVALHMAKAAALSGSQTVVYSIEMAGERLADRLILSHAQIGADQWKTGQLNEQELGVAQAAVSNLSQLPMRVDDTGSAGMDYIRASARMLHSKGLCDIVFIDYLQLCQMKADKYTRNREQEVAQAAHKAKMLARELNIPVVLLSQLNRESENRPGRKPMLSDLRESGAIEQDADLVMLLFRPAMAQLPTDKESGYPSDGLGIVIVAKHRNGQTGNVYFGHNPSMTCIGDYVPPIEWMQRNSKQIEKKE